MLDALPAVFARFYDLYEPFTADFIYSSALEFITGTALEPQTKHLPLIRSADRFPLYLRELCGIGEGYAHMIFPKRLGVSIVEYIEAVPDMIIWINLSNDLLSFVSLFCSPKACVADRTMCVNSGFIKRSLAERQRPTSICVQRSRKRTTCKCLLRSKMS